jgi:signal transduction histidine kinase
MEQRIKRVRRLFTFSIVGLCVASMALLLGILYITSSISFDKSTSAGQLESLTADYPAVAAYLEQEKKSEAHFITIANLVKQDQQQLLGRAALLVALPLLCISGLLGYILARYLLQPVNDTFASQERFLQDAAHELRNPLATMSAVIQQARHSKTSTDIEKSLGIVERQTNHLVRINEDLLFLESRHQTDEPPINAGDLLRDVTETLQPLASAQTIRIKVTIPKDGIVLAVRKKDFICLVRNLLENAIKYSANSKKRTVTLSLAKDPKHTILTIKDNGIGIASQDLPHMGQRFYRGQNVGRHEGNGLGLAIVYKVAAAYGAEVQIQSTEGVGTTVRVTFRA